MASTKMSTTTIILFCLHFCMFYYTHGASYKEGETATLQFYFPDEVNSSFTLRIGNNTPFYENGLMTSTGLSESQSERFSVQGKTNEVILIIRDLTRDDMATYTYEVDINGEKQDGFSKHIQINVNLPFNNHSCHSTCNEMGINGKILMIECEAFLWRDTGEIRCYQLGELALPFTYPQINSTSLSQKIWIFKNLPLHCCFSSQQRPRAKHNCTDFYWSPQDETGRIWKDSVLCTTKVSQSSEKGSDNCVTFSYDTEPETTESASEQNVNSSNELLKSLNFLEKIMTNFGIAIVIGVFIVLSFQIYIMYKDITLEKKLKLYHAVSDYDVNEKYLNIQVKSRGTKESNLNSYEIT